MSTIKEILKHLPYGGASFLGVLGLILLLPGGVLILICMALANLGDRLTSGPWRDNY
jgi:hypothetical protein